MNPDIQRIAEKWAEGYKDPQVSAYEVIKAALEELSALRDTQERELREEFDRVRCKLSKAKRITSEMVGCNCEPGSFIYGCRHVVRRLREALSETAHVEPDSLASLRTELARRDEVEKELREKLEQTESMATEDVAYQNTHILQKDQLIASLRSRIGELEAQVEDARNQWLERDT